MENWWPYRVLGLQRRDNPSNNAIREAYRNEISFHHTDKGGNLEMAMKVNRAAAVLLDSRLRNTFDSHYDLTRDLIAAWKEVARTESKINQEQNTREDEAIQRKEKEKENEEKDAAIEELRKKVLALQADLAAKDQMIQLQNKQLYQLQEDRQNLEEKIKKLKENSEIKMGTKRKFGCSSSSNEDEVQKEPSDDDACHHNFDEDKKSSSQKLFACDMEGSSQPPAVSAVLMSHATPTGDDNMDFNKRVKGDVSPRTVVTPASTESNINGCFDSFDEYKKENDRLKNKRSPLVCHACSSEAKKFRCQRTRHNYFNDAKLMDHYNKYHHHRYLCGKCFLRFSTTKERTQHACKNFEV